MLQVMAANPDMASQVLATNPLLADNPPAAGTDAADDATVLAAVAKPRGAGTHHQPAGPAGHDADPTGNGAAASRGPPPCSPLERLPA
ncbi:hypothetical protein MRX96_059735 [Rhipicephalus microplus]